ncbi:hypothetical protein GCM10022267_41380 [Lentzea roselyniae]|uniref:DUF3558 domain-containing protein n=1 Tax=Lentzea roselyniae TaxID=531940 RepID=A0ABP7B8D1_9PSEU
MRGTATALPDLDLSKFTNEPCALLTPAQVAGLGTLKTPEPRQAPLGPQCRWDPQKVTKPAYSVTLATKGQTMESLREKFKDATKYRETVVSGYPAFSYDAGDGKGMCNTVVDSSHKDAIVVNVIGEFTKAAENTDYCDVAEMVAASVVANVKP